MTDAPAATEGVLAPAVLARLARLQLGAQRRLAGRFGGEHRSPRYGTSLDFADYREYHPGDDYRRIDYSLYARTDQLFIRLFEAEDDLHLRLLVDRSGSMRFNGKLAMAARLAAALGFVALTRRDVVTLETFPAAGPPRRFNGQHAIAALLDSLSTLSAAGLSDLDTATAEALARPGLPGMTVVVSDLLTASWESAIDRLPSRGGEMAVVHVLADEELHPTLSGDLDIADAETDAHLAVSLSHDALSRYAAATEDWLARVAARCHARGASYTRVLASDDVETVLFRHWRDVGLLR